MTPQTQTAKPARHRPLPLRQDRFRKPEAHAKKAPSLGKLALRFLPLGGCGEVTRSCYVYEYGDDIVIVDMGLQFPEEDMPGIDYLIPNIEYLIPKKRTSAELSSPMGT